MEITRVGVDIAKAVFQVHGVDRFGRPVWKCQLRRGNWLRILTERLEPGCEIGMEACSGAHHWARELHARGSDVRLIPPPYVRSYVKRQKNDATDAEAICEAASVGLTPRHHGTGGKNRLMSITKQGDRYLRTILIHGARSAVLQAHRKRDPVSRWVTRLEQRSHPNVAAVTLANKTVRVAWAMLRNGTDFDPKVAVA